MATKKRTSKTQLSIYFDHLNENKMLMVHGKLQAYNNPEDLRKVWEALTERLNSCGDGPVRTLQEWKKVFTEWKSLVRKKARELKPLNHLETKFISLTGSAAVDRLNTAEHGIQMLKNHEGLIEYEENMEGEIEQAGELTEGAIEVGEEILIEVVTDGTKKKRIRQTTNDVLTNAYQKASTEQAEGLDHIANAILEVAKAIDRYCDICEKEREETNCNI